MTRPRLLVLNQYYRPGVEATANLLADLCEALAEGYDVTVVTGRLHQFPDLPSEETLNGVRVLRARSTSFDRTRLGPRAVNYATYLADSVVRSLALERPDVVLCLTDPPMIGDIGLLVARRFGVPLVVVSEDVFPEIAVEVGRLDNPVLVGVLRTLVNLYLRRADRVVAIGETMRRRLVAKGAHPERVVVIPNWVDTRAIRPLPADNAWAREQDLVGRFVVMHSGNVGHAQDLDTLVRAADLLRDLDDLVVVIVGFGARGAEINALAASLGLPNLRFLPYQPRERLSESLSSASLHVVGLAPGLAGYVVPSRLYGILAAGRAVVAHADPDSETAQLVQDAGCGVALPPGRPELLAAAIRDLHRRPDDLVEMGRRGRAWVEREADRQVAVARYRDLLAELVPVRRPVRVLRAIARLNVGGPALHVSYLTRGLDARAYETTLVAGQVGAGEGSMEYVAGELGLRPVPIGSLQREIAPLADVRSLVRLVRLLRRARPDIVHTHTAKAGALGRLAVALSGVRPRPAVVHTYHGHVLSGYFSPRVAEAYRWIERLLAHGSDALVAVSPEVRDDLVRLGVAPASRFAVVRLGLELERRTTAARDARGRVRDELGVDETTMLVLWLGRMTTIKRVDLLVEAFARLRERGVDSVLVLAGDGPDRPDLEGRVAELGLDDAVRFLGFREEVGELYAAADVVALSSANEGTPVSLIEALAAGRAVVTTDVGGARDVVAAGAAGLLVPPGDPDALADGLAALADPALRERLGAAGRLHVTGRYSVSRLVDDVDRLYRSLLETRGGSGS